MAYNRKQRLNDNIKAIETAFILDREQRTPTARERLLLERYCGFGGLKCILNPAVSTRMGEDKIKRHMATGAEFVTGPDSSCLMHMAGIAKKEKMPIKFIHVVQILAAGL